MIEIIYKEEQKKADGNENFFKIPNNIRQIGEIKGFQKIYIEDYAYTFLKKISRGAGEEGKAAILFGKYHWSEGNSYLFIKSALQIDEMEVSQEHVVFSDKVWGQVYEEGKKYFPEQEIVGWFVCLPGFHMQINEVLLKTHLNHFAGNDKTLFVMEPGEWEEAFFLYENNQLVRQPGYYIYYEKNDAMQAYMIDKNQNKSIEETESVPDRAVVDFRRVVREKSGEEKEKKTVSAGKISRRSWMAGTCAAAAVLAIGITFLNSYQNMKGTIGALIPGAGSAQEEEAEMVSTGNVQATVTPGVKEKETGFMEGAQETETEQAQTDLDAQEQQGETDGTEKNGQDERMSSQAGMQTGGEHEVSTQQEETEAEQKEQDTTSAESEQDKARESAAVPDNGISIPDNHAPAQEYVIQRGDTMTGICRKKYGSIARLEEICRLNGISTDDIIYAGEKIILPD